MDTGRTATRAQDQTKDPGVFRGHQYSLNPLPFNA